MRDDSAERVSQSRRDHTPIGELEALVQVTEPAATESVNSWDAEVGPSGKMVKRKTMIVDWFLVGAYPAAQPHPQGKDQTPPPPPPFPPVSRAKKKQHVTDQPPRVPSDAPSRTLPRVSGRITI